MKKLLFFGVVLLCVVVALADTMQLNIQLKEPIGDAEADRNKCKKLTKQGVLDMLNECRMISRNVFADDDPMSCNDVCGQFSETCIYAGSRQMGRNNYATYGCNYPLYDTQSGVNLNCLCCSA